jgi:hypothetical protein
LKLNHKWPVTVDHAAEAILKGPEYSLDSIPRYSFPSVLGLRKGG